MNRPLRTLLRWGLTGGILALLVVFAREVDWACTGHALRTAAPWPLLAATVVNLLSLALRGARWWIFLRAVGAPNFPLAIRATVAGAGLNNVLVANGGDAARVVFVTRATPATSAAVLATFAFDRLFDVGSYILLLVTAALLLPLPPELTRWRTETPLALAVLLLIMGVLVRWGGPEEEDSLPAPQLSTLVRWGRAYVRRFVWNMTRIATAPRLAAAFGVTMLAWVGQFATYHLAAVALAFPISLTGTFAALLAVNLSFVFRVTPGNVGVFQLVYAFTAVAFGLPRDEAVAVAFLIQAVQILPVTLLGVALAPEFVMRKAADAA